MLSTLLWHRDFHNHLTVPLLLLKVWPLLLHFRAFDSGSLVLESWLYRVLARAFKDSVSRIVHSFPHKVNSEGSHLNPILLCFCSKRTNVNLPNTQVCLHGLLVRASPSKRVDGIIRNTYTTEHDSI